MILPKMLGQVTDGLSNATIAVNDAYRMAFVMLGFAVLLFVTRFFYRILIVGKSRDLECFLRERLFLKLQELPPSFYNQRKTGDLMAYATNDLSAVRMAFAMGIINILDSFLVQGTAIVTMVITINPILTLLSVFPIVLSVVITLRLRMAVRRRFKLVQDQYSALNDKVQENIMGIRVVKAYTREESETKRLEEASIKRYKVQMNYVRLAAFMPVVNGLSFGIAFTVAIVLGANMVKTGIITVGDFVAFQTYLTLMTMPISMLGRVIELWQRAMASLKRLEEILFITPEIRDVNVHSDVKSVSGNIEISNFTFTYPGANTPALKNINLKLPRGKTLGIIGRTGSGKTTLANVLLRLYLIKEGYVKVDNKEINRLPLSSLRGSIGYVPQDNFMFAASILDNIKFFDENITDEAVFEAAKTACVYDNIIAFPEGFQTVTGERGITLSGGQKQRVSIARAIVKKPNILILDDALSAVDTETEERILRNLGSVMDGLTNIVISHRVSAIRHADEIIFMDGGEIIERGTHEELLALGGAYCRLDALQAGGDLNAN